MAGRKNQTPNKQNSILEKFIKWNGEDNVGNLRNNVNWATAEEVEKLRKANTEDFFRAVRSRTTPPVSSQVFTIGEDQRYVSFIFRHSLNIRDMGNPWFGEEDKSDRKELVDSIRRCDPNKNSVCVLYAGDLLGGEWELKRINNAKIISDSSPEELKGVAEEVYGDGASELKGAETIRKALYFALAERTRVLERDIRFALAQGAEVYLFNGAQENKINSYFKINILETVVAHINHPRLHFIEGVNTVVNLEKANAGGNPYYCTVGLLTNNGESKAVNGQSAVGAVMKNSGKNLADIVFATNTNVAGKKGPNLYFPSGQSTYINIAKKKMPVLAPKRYNVFTIALTGNHEFSVIEGPPVPAVNPLEKAVYDEMMRQEYIREIILLDVEKKLTSVTSHQPADPVKTMQYFMSRHHHTETTDSTKGTPVVAPVVEAPEVREDANGGRVDAYHIFDDDDTSGMD